RQHLYRKRDNELPGIPLYRRAGWVWQDKLLRWNALNDLEKLLDGRSSTLPVYVPLHQVADIEKRSFKEAFLQHAGVSALLPKHGRTHYNRTRVYLDGMDEVPSPATQKRISQLAAEATKHDPSLQVIITARDYVYEP